uniref:F-box domain-containing protein n=1 Tax=Aureoumbra lagunensis TaxID=44058 RepID=A0A7S3JXG9_9STRA|mmetsp:Transcript_21951/g.33859  ORF Transcript_21951/g.33859 Transcript_21951/m.33859 type:complete len:538 (+) Transcript_21951:96-1709(+)
MYLLKSFISDEVLKVILSYLDVCSLAAIDTCAADMQEETEESWFQILRKQYSIHFTDSENSPRYQYLRIRHGDEVLSWYGEEIPEIRMKSGFTACFAGDDVLIIFGIMKIDGEKQLAALLLHKGRAMEVAPISSPRIVESPDCVATSEYFLVFGGISQNARVNDTRILHIEEKNWTQLSMPDRPPTCHHSLDLIKSRYTLLLGGQVFYGEPIFDPFILDLQQPSLSWQRFQAAGSIPSSRAQHITLWNEESQFFFLAGGLSASLQGTNNDVYILDARSPLKHQWHWTQVAASSTMTCIPSKWLVVTGVSNIVQIKHSHCPPNDNRLFGLWRCQFLFNNFNKEANTISLLLAGEPGVCSIDINLSTGHLLHCKGIAPPLSNRNYESMLDMQFTKIGPILVAFGGSNGRQGVWYESPGHWSTKAIWFDSSSPSSWLNTSLRLRLPREDRRGSNLFFSSSKAGDVALQLPSQDGMLIVSRASYPADSLNTSSESKDTAHLRRGQLRLDILRPRKVNYSPFFFQNGYSLDIPLLEDSPSLL